MPHPAGPAGASSPKAARTAPARAPRASLDRSPAPEELDIACTDDPWRTVGSHSSKGAHKAGQGKGPAPPASSAAAGVCVSQVFSENAQGTNSGMDNDQAAATGSSQLLLKLGGLALSLPLDALKHPIDILFTYAQGVIMGLQDILQTVDQRK